MSSTSSKVSESWRTSRTILEVYFAFFAALGAGFFLYVIAVRYIQSYDFNCSHPGTFYSEIWSFNFVIQALYGIILFGYVVLLGFMLIEWNRVEFYIAFLLYSLLISGWLLGTAVYMSFQASQANTCLAVGNPFNDFRICGVCGTYLAWDNYCFGTAPYSPLVTGGLSINVPKAFQLGFHWTFAVLIPAMTFFVVLKYRKDQKDHINELAKTEKLFKQFLQEQRTKQETVVVQQTQGLNNNVQTMSATTTSIKQEKKNKRLLK